MDDFPMRQEVIDLLVNDVWQTCRRSAPSPELAVQACEVVWRRLADELATGQLADLDEIGVWLRLAALDECDRAGRLAQWHGVPATIDLRDMAEASAR
jgi:hypothetical protein